MTVHEFDPIRDPRWQKFIDVCPDATVFHTPGWLEALRRTYSYEPVAYTTSPPNTDLRNGLVFCRIKSWLTGRRLVSLPFSDHCHPLVSVESDLRDILNYLQDVAPEERWKYVEIRPLPNHWVRYPEADFRESANYRFHRIDLRPSPDAIYRKFHDSCVRRKIRKAEREGLEYEAGHSEKLLSQFHYLLLLTRRRHMLPPQPLAWFRNLIECLDTQITIHMVTKDSEPVASIITLAHKQTLVYKYGCSAAKYNALGGTPLLFWKAIQEAKLTGVEELDLGRSDPQDQGLSNFKEHLGGVGVELNYYRYSQSPVKASAGPAKPSRLRQIVAQMPDSIFAGVGSLLYRHIG